MNSVSGLGNIIFEGDASLDQNWDNYPDWRDLTQLMKTSKEVPLSLSSSLTLVSLVYNKNIRWGKEKMKMVLWCYCGDKRQGRAEVLLSAAQMLSTASARGAV